MAWHGWSRRTGLRSSTPAKWTASETKPQLLGTVLCVFSTVICCSQAGSDMGIVLNYCQHGVLYLGSYYNTGPYINFPHFGNSNFGNLPYTNSGGKQLTAVRASAQDSRLEERMQSLGTNSLQELCPGSRGGDCRHVPPCRLLARGPSQSYRALLPASHGRISDGLRKPEVLQIPENMPAYLIRLKVCLRTYQKPNTSCHTAAHGAIRHCAALGMQHIFRWNPSVLQAANRHGERP